MRADRVSQDQETPQSLSRFPSPLANPNIDRKLGHPLGNAIISDLADRRGLRLRLGQQTYWNSLSVSRASGSRYHRYRSSVLGLFQHDSQVAVDLELLQGSLPDRLARSQPTERNGGAALTSAAHF
jgi:hypothetical protein